MKNKTKKYSYYLSDPQASDSLPDMEPGVDEKQKRSTLYGEFIKKASKSKEAMMRRCKRLLNPDS